MKSLVTALLLFVFLGVFLTDCPMAQQSSAVSTAQSASGATTAPSRFQIQRNFLIIDRADLTRRVRQLQRCVRNARENLVDIQGNLNRVAQTDLINCGRQLEMLLRQQQRLTRRSNRIETEARLEAEILAQMLRQAAAMQNVSSSLSQISGSSSP